MVKKSKADKRKTKVKAKKQQAVQNERSLSIRLGAALEKLCEPVMPEYIDDSNGIDLVGRRIVWQMGQIAWNIAVTGRKEIVDGAFQESHLDAAEQETVRNEIAGLVKRKYVEFPNLRTAIRDISVSPVNVTPCLKVRPGDAFPELPMSEFVVPKPVTVSYSEVIKGKFISRPNRFVANVRIGDAVHSVHVKNTGRCKELLPVGTTVYLAAIDNPARKMRFDLIAVEKMRQNGTPLLINMDSQLPNEAVAKWLPHSGLFSPGCIIHREVTYRKSRFDFMLEDGGRKICLEVKGVTLENNGVALFPDAPTERGVKHLNELSQTVADGLEAWVVFVIQMKEVHEFRPNDKMHKDFGNALRNASTNGVKILAMDCVVTADSIAIDKPVSVNLLEECR